MKESGASRRCSRRNSVDRRWKRRRRCREPLERDARRKWATRRSREEQVTRGKFAKKAGQGVVRMKRERVWWSEGFRCRRGESARRRCAPVARLLAWYSVRLGCACAPKERQSGERSVCGRACAAAHTLENRCQFDHERATRERDQHGRDGR